VRGFRNRKRSHNQDTADMLAGLQKDHFDSLAAKLQKIELETTIQQLQHELKVRVRSFSQACIHCNSNCQHLKRDGSCM